MTSDLLIIGERQPRESKKAVIACNDYLRMGPGRSLRKLAEKYSNILAEGEQKPPTTREPTLFRWSADYGWVERSEQYDAKIEDEKNERRKEIMESGLALDYERVVKLKVIFDRLEHELIERNKLWLTDWKAIDKEAVEIKRYNTSLINDLRGLLDDLAKETGGRVNKQEVSGADGKEIVFRVVRGDE